MSAPPTVIVRDLEKSFRATGRWGFGGAKVRALDGVNFQLQAGEFAALVGESGSGKTTLGRLLLGLIPFQRGSVEVLGRPVGCLRGQQRRQFRRSAQMVFQNPYASLNPAFRVRATLAEAVRVHRNLTAPEVEREVLRLAHLVHLPRARLDEYPTSLSGGERRRVGFARALATRPQFIVTDEPVAGLDPPIQVQLLDLLARIHQRREITFLLISHDMRAVRRLASRVLVLYRGHLVEDAPATRFFTGRAQHPYSLDLLRSAFDAAGSMRARCAVVRQSQIPRGCPYRARCQRADVEEDSPCATIAPPLEPQVGEHRVACHKRENE